MSKVQNNKIFSETSCFQRKQVEDRIISPLKLTLKQMTGPQLLINKRFDKLLDYEKSLDYPDERTQVRIDLFHLDENSVYKTF